MKKSVKIKLCFCFQASRQSQHHPSHSKGGHSHARRNRILQRSGQSVDYQKSQMQTRIVKIVSYILVYNNWKVIQIFHYLH